MMSNNKILTVSYGTFSCTLEGFDDSFGTMKAIAEYFRDLASDDRYFGAEPPQPDAEMLSRIAQKEISRRVEVREHEGKIVISATPDDDQVTLEAPALATTQANVQADALIAAEAARATLAQAEENAEHARVQAEAEAKAAADADAASLENARLEAARVEEVRLEAERQEAQRVQEEATIEPIETPAEEIVPRDLAAELPEAEAFFASSSDETEDDDTEVDAVDTAQVAAASEAHDDSIAAKLQRIRAVVSNADQASDEEDFSEDQHAEDFGSNAVEETHYAVTNDTTDDDSFDIADFSVDTSDATETKADFDVQAEAIADIEAASQADDFADVQADQTAMDDDDMSAILARLEGSKFDAAEDDDDEIVSIETIEETADGENLFDDTIYAGDDALIDVDLEDDLEPKRIARVIKVKRADLEAAIAQGDLEEIEEGDDSSLSDADEAELALDLANVEIDLADLEDPESESLFEDDTFEEAIAPQSLPQIDGADDDDLSRLLAEADQQMDDEEGKQSRDAFSHLKAAVAVKKADAGLAEPTAEEEEVAYRSDLATAVKPRRPSAGGARSERPTQTERPAPLKLVAEQRVDAADLDTRGPVRPRRVALQEAAVNNEAESFVEFAEDMGASELPDLLEAAAAYMSFVEGREQFSRPQLMNKVRSVEKENFSREDGLRSFGKLLRAGKIEKIKGGRFTVTNDIGYRPDARAVG
ncbi:MAG: hypothetical protein ACI84R_003724 [Candidatus Azotimanducaceae bacterium]|jgi:hypothetical protein